MLTLRSLTVVAVVAVVAAVALGCSDDSEPPPSATPKETCEAPNRVVGKRCLEPYVQDDGCAAGTLGLEDGSCRPAGVPPELCATGFVHDGDATCEPVLPDVCPPGQMALPGEATCRPVMDCGSGRWGDIPVDGATIYVDAAYSGVMSDGSVQQPYTTVSDAVTAAPDGALIAIAPGSYTEDVVVQKQVRLWGVCPERVEIAGTGASLSTLELFSSSDGSEVHGLAVTGPRVGILIWGTQGIVVDRLWVHGTLDHGVAIQFTYGAVEAAVLDSLIEANEQIGVHISGAQVALDGVVVRETRPDSDQRYGRGINIQPDKDALEPATVSLSGSVVEDNRDTGVYASGAQLALDGVVVRRTQPQLSDQFDGRGVGVHRYAALEAGGATTITRSVIEYNHAAGVCVVGADVLLDGVAVRRTLPQALDQSAGLGIGINLHLGGVVSNVTVRNSLVDQSYEHGVLVAASQATLDGVAIRGTLARASDGLFGDGVTVSSGLLDDAPVVGKALITRTSVRDNERAGVSGFGAEVSVGASALSCNGFQLDEESFLGLAANFEDLGANGCGCPEPSGECVAETSGLAPPELPASM